MYYNGENVKQNYEQALYWCKKAAAQGYQEAKDALKTMKNPPKPEPIKKEEPKSETHTNKKVLNLKNYPRGHELISESLAAVAEDLVKVNRRKFRKQVLLRDDLSLKKFICVFGKVNVLLF